MNTIIDYLQGTGLDATFLNIIGGLLILLVGFFFAKLIGNLIGRLFRIFDKKKSDSFLFEKFFGKLVYYVLMVFVLMMALSVFGVSDIALKPLNKMVEIFISAIPNVIIAGIIIYAGYILSKIISELIGFSAEAVSKWTTKYKLPEGFDFIKFIKTVVKVAIFIPILIVGLDFLNFEVITNPASDMLGQFLSSIPLIVKAIAIIVVFYFGGKIIKDLLRDLLSSLNLDGLSEKLLVDKIVSGSLSNFIANLTFILIVYMSVMQAFDVLYLTMLSEVMINVLGVAGKIGLGLLIVMLGNMVSNFVKRIVQNNQSVNQFSLKIINIAIVFIFLALGLSAMDISDAIINLAFGLSLGAIAIAFALSFGLGGKEAAGKEMQNFFQKFKQKDNE